MVKNDSANQLIRENNQAGGYTYVWDYDKSGNILSRTKYTYTTGALGAATETINYSYSDSGWGDIMTSYNGIDVHYDGSGNFVYDGTNLYTWEHGHELAAITPDDQGAEWTFAYNADGMRIQRSNGETTYKYVYTGGQLSQMTVGSNTLRFTYDADGTPLTVIYNGTTYYYATNLQGDVVAILDGNGVSVATYTYDAWGNLPEDFEPVGLGKLNPLRYRGYVYDEETKLYYLQSRYYNPAWGRFISADSFVSTGQGLLGNNMFMYCLNNPVNMIDNDGCAAKSIWSFRSDAQGRDILLHYLFGKGKTYTRTNGYWGSYMMRNRTLKKKVQGILFPIGKELAKGASRNIDIVTSMEIDNGEDIIGYQYLHGTNADVGGFSIKGKISKDRKGNITYDLTYTWNDIIDPNFTYASDRKKVAFAKRIPFANPTDYIIRISWTDKTVIKARSGLFNWNRGWLK